jgi:hypothetical protein
MMMNKHSSTSGRFDGHGGSLEQYIWHRLMRHVQGYSGNHWAPPLGDYSLCIAPVAARATSNKTTTKKCTKKTGHFDGCGGAPVQYGTHCPIEEVQGFTRSHWMPPSGKHLLQ